MASKCELCGEPMPEGEEMFKFHGYSGNCPKPPLPKEKKLTYEELTAERDRLVKELEEAKVKHDVACATIADQRHYIDVIQRYI